MGELLVELWAFMRERKKYWLLPIVAVLLLHGHLEQCSSNRRPDRCFGQDATRGARLPIAKTSCTSILASRLAALIPSERWFPTTLLGRNGPIRQLESIIGFWRSCPSSSIPLSATDFTDELPRAAGALTVPVGTFRGTFRRIA